VLEDREFRELLVADVALMQGIASAGDVAAALQRFWERRDRDDVSVAGELARIADIDRDVLRPVEAVVDGLIAHAAGNARVAFTQHGGLDRSVTGTPTSRSRPAAEWASSTQRWTPR
jgi:hypothetical protein